MPFDSNPPVVFNCPSDIYTPIEIGISQVAVSWIEPSAVDIRGNIIYQEATHRSGDMFSVDSSSDVSYIFVDDSENAAYCNFTVLVFVGKCICFSFSLKITSYNEHIKLQNTGSYIIEQH